MHKVTFFLSDHIVLPVSVSGGLLVSCSPRLFNQIFSIILYHSFGESWPFPEPAPRKDFWGAGVASPAVKAWPKDFQKQKSQEMNSWTVN